MAVSDQGLWQFMEPAEQIWCHNDWHIKLALLAPWTVKSNAAIAKRAKKRYLLLLTSRLHVIIFSWGFNFVLPLWGVNRNLSLHKNPTNIILNNPVNN